jgi:hypothetical protein
MGMETTSPLFIEYGRLVETKNGWKTLSLVGFLVSPRPVSGSMLKPVMIHEVMVSGTFFVRIFVAFGLGLGLKIEIG